MRFLQNLMRGGRWFSVTNKSCLLAHNLFRIKILDKAYSFHLIRLAEKIEWKEFDKCFLNTEIQLNQGSQTQSVSRAA